MFPELDNVYCKDPAVRVREVKLPGKIGQYRMMLRNPKIDPYWHWRKRGPSLVARRSPDICSEQRVPSLRSPRKPYEPISPRKATKQPSTRRVKNSDLNLNQEHHTLSQGYLAEQEQGTSQNTSSKRNVPSSDGGESLEEFSPTYEEDTEPEGDMETISPFVQDMFFNPDTSLMDAFGSLLVPDPFISSSEPLADCEESLGNDGLNTPPYRSPSPVLSPIMSPQTPETPVMYPPPEPEISPMTRRSLRKAPQRVPAITTPTKALHSVNGKRAKEVLTPRKGTQNVSNSSPEERKMVAMKGNKESPREAEALRLRKRKRPSSPVEVHDTPPKSSIVPYVDPVSKTLTARVGGARQPQRTPAIKPDTSPTSSTERGKTFKERMIDFVENYEPYERPGKLLRLRLNNFMCHDDFDEDWHRMVNYITADNGAGKSAILVALQLVFGAKASTTMRSTCVKDLIQYGKDQSTIEITLSNDGILDIEKYGHEIHIIRTIRWNGTSWYSIGNGNGKGKRSLSRKELELIKATLQIMVDNPAMILNQEASRNFLRTTDPQALYSYFYRGLNLEHCEVLLIRSKDDIEAARNALGSKHKMLDELQAKAREFKSDYDAVLILENGKERAQKLQREYHWSIVSQVEKELSTLEYKLDMVVEKCGELEKQLVAISDQQNSLDTNQESSKTQLKKLKRVLHSKREELDLKCREAHSHRQDVGNAKTKLGNVTKVINEKKSRLEGIEKEVDRLREESNANYKERVREIENQKRELHQRRVEARERLALGKANKEEVYTKYDRCKQTQVEWHEKYEDIQFRIREKKHELINIEKKQNSKYNRYGSEMVKLMSEIEKMVKKRQFKEPPTGPQSAGYTLKESFREYAPLIEHILGSTLFQIRVGHVQDKVLLQELMKRIYGNKPQPDILYHPIKNRERYNLLNVKANSGHNTVLDALDILDDDPVIVNWLADSNGIEKILLFRSEEEACNIMKEARRVPRGCSIAYSLNFKRIHADPHFRSMVINPVKTKTSFIQITSRLGNDELVKNEIRELEIEASEVLGMLETAKREAKIAKETDREVDRELKAAQNEVNSLETSFKGLEDTIAQGPDLASYIEDAEELRTSLKQNTAEKGHLESLVKELKPKYDAAESEKRSLEESIGNTEAEIQIVENQSDFAKRANDLRIKSKNLNEELTNQNASKQSLTKKVKEITTSLDKSVKVATSKGSRVQTKRDPVAIKEELRCLEQMLHKNRNKISQKGKLMEDWERAQEIADEVEQDIRSASNLIDTLIPTITTQFRRFDKKKNDFGNTLQASFQALVSSRNFGGKLIIDHKERNLMFWVCPDTNSEERAKVYKKNLENCMLYKKGMGDYIKGLSGGERSFSTICFMVSMWKTMESPFYVLDEFDVFMDQANRKASQLILNAHTRSQPEAQFIFITPLKLDSIVYPENAKLLRLYPPIRDSTQAEDEAAHRAKLLKLAEDKKGATTAKKKKKRPHLEDGTGKRVDDYFDYLYKPPPPVPIMC